LTFAISLSPSSARSLLKEKSYQAVKADAFINYQKSTIEKINPTTIKVSGENFFEMWKRYFLR